MSSLGDYNVPGALQHGEFCPHADNGGSVVAIAGDDFAVIAADTRSGRENSRRSREQSKLLSMSAQVVLGVTGCHCDALALAGVIKARIQMYEQTLMKTITTEALTQILSIIMFRRRYLPYYVCSILAGLDKHGKGAVYSYDSLGQYDRETYYAIGTGGLLIQPILEGFKNQKSTLLTKERAVAIASDTLISAAGRDKYSGNSGLVNIITKAGIEVQTFKLRKD